MSSHVSPDGDVVPPLNISAPAPIVNLRGFKWRTVDEKLHGPRPTERHEEHHSTESQPAFEVPSLERATVAPVAKAELVAVPAPAALPAPQLPLSVAALPTQLPGQLGLTPGLSASAPTPPPFPLAQFQGAYAGNGFNLIFRPRPTGDTTFSKPTVGPNDNILELNLTTEQLTFGNTIGSIPNRGLTFNGQPDIFLAGLPYLQTVQDVTNIESGRGDSPTPSGIHFEPGMWLSVPACTNPKNAASVVRMASIPHGTTINAQGLAPQKASTTLGGVSGPPNFDDPSNVVDATPFGIDKFSPKVPFPSQTAETQNTPRLPQDLTKFIAAGTITTDIIKNPNLVLKNAINGQKIVETISFQVSTGPFIGPGTATLNGGGTANISFLAGTQNPITTAAPGASDAPNAHASFMTAKVWVETVAYQVTVPRITTPDRFLLRPTMPPNSSAPTPVFAITPPRSLPSESKTITIPGIQIQTSQVVNLNFGPPPGPGSPGILSWPHVSVATLVPADPQPFAMT